MDIPGLAAHFLDMLCRERGLGFEGFSPKAMDKLLRCEWPGNVRQLRNVVECATVLETARTIRPESVRTGGCGGCDETAGDDADESDSDEMVLRVADRSLRTAERELVKRVLQETGWKKAKAAALLGITRTTLYSKIREYQIVQTAAS